METWDAIRSRRNVREFADRPVAREHLDQILEAGWRSPSARNEQPWDYVVVTDREELAELSKVFHGAAYAAGSAATIAPIGPIPGDEKQLVQAMYDLGQATTSMMLAAADLGIGSGHAGVLDQDHARRVLGFPDDRFCSFLIVLGYPAGSPMKPVERLNRRPFSDVFHQGRW